MRSIHVCDAIRKGGHVRARTLSFVIGCAAVPYWVLFYVLLFGDYGPGSVAAWGPVRLLVPVILVAHLVGVILGGRSWRTRRLEAATLVALHVLPVIALVGVLWWLFFGVSI